MRYLSSLIWLKWDLYVYIFGYKQQKLSFKQKRGVCCKAIEVFSDIKGTNLVEFQKMARA